MILQFLFIAVALAGVAYLLWRKNADPAALAFASAVVYFAPGFFGFTQFSFGDGSGQYSAAIVPGAYAIMLLALAAIAASAAIADRIKPTFRIAILGQEHLPYALMAVMMVAWAISLARVGGNYLCTDKDLMMSHIDQWYYYAAYAAPLCLAVGYAQKAWIAVGAAALFVAFDLFIGFRATAAISFLALAMISGDMLFKSAGRGATYIAIILACGLGLVIVKQATYSVKYAVSTPCFECEDEVGAPAPLGPSAAEQISFMSSELLSGNLVFRAIVASEPFVIAATLNEVIAQDFRLPAPYLADQFWSGLPGAQTVFGRENAAPKTFDSYFRPVLFPEVKTFSMAGNPWAQAYAVGGYPAAVAFTGFFAAAVFGLSLVYRISQGALRGAVAVVSTWFVFYGHRNDFAVELGILKQTVYIFALAAIVSAGVEMWRRSRRSGHRPSI